MNYVKHEFNFFPTNENDYKNIVKNMRENGYDITLPIIIFEGKILDGWHRYKASQEVGIKAEAIQFNGSKEDALLYSIRTNKDRRHLGSSQLATLAVQAEPLFKAIEEETRKKQREKQKENANNQFTKEASGKKIPEGILSEPFVKKFTEGSPKQNKQEPSIRTAEKVAEIFNTNKDYINQAKKLKEESPEKFEQVMKGEKNFSEIKKEEKKEIQQKQFQALKEKENLPIVDKYDVIVIDPPWQMEKIEREVAPNQVGFDYPTMTIDDIKNIKIPAEDNCHLFMWTTQKYLPASFEILNTWGFKYVFTMVWHKNGGFQPFNLPMYNCEFILYGRKGTPSFVDLKQFFTCFNADRKAHSEKPEEFYNVIRRVTAGKKLDMFNRRLIEGFDTWGNESI